MVTKARKNPSQHYAWQITTTRHYRVSRAGNNHGGGNNYNYGLGDGNKHGLGDVKNHGGGGCNNYRGVRSSKNCGREGKNYHRGEGNYGGGSAKVQNLGIFSL